MITYRVGESYLFKVYKKVEIGDDTFFMLLDPNGKKYLLPAVNYPNYNLIVGSKINCKIDKINCTGKMYIEPEHPIYRASNIETFEFVNEFSFVNEFAESERRFTVIDAFNKELIVPVVTDIEKPLSGEKIELFISRITKGKPVLFLASEFQKKLFNKKGERSLYKIDGLTTINHKVYFRLTDENGNFYFLRQKFYSDRKYKVDDNIYCTLINDPIPGIYCLEPDYPEYIKGEIYSFEFLRYDKHFFRDGRLEEVVIVTDKFMKECTLFVEMHRFIESEIIESRVESVYKGKLLLRHV